MNTNKLYEFVIPLIEDENTTMKILTSHSSSGEETHYQYINDIWHFSLTMYCDKNNGFNFKFEYSSEQSYVPFPTFRTEDTKIIHPIIDQIMLYKEKVANKDIPDAKEYVELFKKILMNESLPDQYTVTFENKGIQLHSSEWKGPITIYERDLNYFYSSKDSMNEPLSYTCLALNCAAWGNNEVFICIAKTQLEKYVLLHSKGDKENLYGKPLDVGAWLNEIRNNNEISSPQVHSLINYVLLKDELSSNDEPCDEKPHKPRSVKI